MEESLLEQNREMESKVESLESIVRMLELRAKNASDHGIYLFILFFLSKLKQFF